MARGARMVEYWHWHSIHFGHETYWLGVLNHDGEPGRCYDEVKRIAGDFKRAGAAVADLVPDADVGLLYSRESRWAMEFQPPLPVEGGLEPDRGSYDRIFGRFYEGLFGAGLQADIVYPQHLGSDAEALVARWPVLVVPALYVADDVLLDLLDAYARAGGHLVLGFRSGYADDEARPRAGGHAGPAARGGRGQLRRVHEPGGAGAAARGTDAGFALPDGATATAWADALVPEGAETLVRLRAPAPRPLGGGDHQRARRRARDLRRARCPTGRWPSRWRAGCGPRPTPGRTGPRRSRSRARATAEGGRLRFVSNWSWEPTSLALPVAARDLLSETDLRRGEELDLAAWDVRVLLESARENNEEDSL